MNWCLCPSQPVKWSGVMREAFYLLLGIDFTLYTPALVGALRHMLQWKCMYALATYWSLPACTRTLHVLEIFSLFD